MKLSGFVKISTVLICSSSCQNEAVKKQSTEQELPNFVIIYCDDLGYGDLSCFGAEDIQTPNIDAISEQGIKFTEFYSASPICTPSRTGLLTGRMPQRMGVHGVFFPESYFGLPENEITLADMLKTAGYTNGIIGKWHLGHRHKYLPLQRGFDEYFGIPYSNDMESVVYIEGNEVVDTNPDQHYITKTYTEKALDFIDRNWDKPFFLYLAHSMPHVPVYASEKFIGSSKRGIYGDVVQELDWSVGEVMNSLKEKGILNNTLVIFSSDNGPWLVMEEYGGSAGILREGKQYTFEGGMRVPTLAMWPGVIEAGRVYNDMALMMDWFPTLVEAAGLEMPDDREYDGESLIPVLNNTAKRKGDKYLYFDNQNLECYRHGDWKVKKAYAGSRHVSWKKFVPSHPVLLVNLKDDPGERINLAEKNPEKLQQMLHEMDSMRNSMGDLPPALFIKSSADHYHYDSLALKHKGDF